MYDYKLGSGVLDRRALGMKEKMRENGQGAATVVKCSAVFFLGGPGEVVIIFTVVKILYLSIKT